MVCTPIDAPLLLSCILHPQYCIRTCLGHNINLLSMEAIPKPLPSGCSDTSGDGYHRGPTEPHSLNTNSIPRQQENCGTTSVSGHIQHGCAKITTKTPGATRESGTDTCTTKERGTSQQPTTTVPTDPPPALR